MANMKLEYYEGIGTTSRARSSGTSTIVCSSNHGLITGRTVTIAGLGGSGYNTADNAVTVTSATTFTYVNAGGDEGTTGDTNGLVYPNFTFQHNPNTFDGTIDPILDITKIKYTFTIIGVAKPLMSNQSLVLTGFFNGSSKDTYYKYLMNHVNINKLQKLYYISDASKFYIVQPQQCKKTNSGQRTYFIDYVATFLSPLGILFSSTQKSGLKNDSGLNAGDVTTPIEMVKTSSNVTSGKEYIIKDKDGNGIKFTANATGLLTIRLITMSYLGGDAYITSYINVQVGTTKQVIRVATDGKSMLILLDPSETITQKFTGGAVTEDGSSWNPTFYWRDGYSSE